MLPNEIAVQYDHSDVINQHCRDLPVLCRTLIVLLLLISGNVHVQPGPFIVDSPISDMCSDICFTDFCSRKSLGFWHVNTRSLLPKMDELKVWVHSSNPDVLVITETWFLFNQASQLRTNSYFQ